MSRARVARRIAAGAAYGGGGIGLAGAAVVGLLLAEAQLGGPLPGPLPLFPRSNWWNLDISKAPVDPDSAGFMNFVGPTRGMHPDFGGEAAPGSVEIYGFPYIVVDSTVPKVAVRFQYWRESDGVMHPDNVSVPFYPIQAGVVVTAVAGAVALGVAVIRRLRGRGRT